MGNTILKSWLIPVFMFAFTAHAGLYKGLDENGNIVYSDTPFDNAEKFTPPSLSIVDAPKIKGQEDVAEEEKPAEFKYTNFNIISPIDNQTIWNEPDLTVSLELKPALNTAEGHTIWLLMDNKPLVKNSQNLSMQIGRADRGAHTLQAHIKNKEGKMVARTRIIIVHIKHTAVPRTSPR